MKFIALAIAIVIVAIFCAVRIASYHWNRSTSKLLNELLKAPGVLENRTFTFEDLKGLPTPVSRYFRNVLRDGQPLIQSVRMIQMGKFNSNESSENWNRFHATEYFTANPPGFVWDASISMAPLLNARVRDGFVSGKSSMNVKLLSIVPLVNAQNQKELDSAALQRYLAEAVWFPTALLPSNGVMWSEVDENKALATLTHSGISVSLEFSFNSNGEVVSVFTPARFRGVGDKYELTPWYGVFRKYEQHDGIRIPVEGEVEWRLPLKNVPYWKGQIVDVHYTFANKT